MTEETEPRSLRDFLQENLPELSVGSNEEAISSDAEVRRLGKQFYAAFSSKVGKLRDAPERFPPQVYKALKAWGVHQTRDVDPEFQSLSNLLLERVSKLAGHKFGFWQDVREMLWKPAEALRDAGAKFDPDQLTAEWIEAIKQRIAYQSTYQGGCYLFSSNLVRERVDVGPLRILIGANVEWAGSAYKELNDKALAKDRPKSPVPFGIAPATWLIRLPASRSGFRSAMRWYVDIFVSLMRLGGVRYLNAPPLGYVEADPFTYEEHISGGVQIANHGACYVGANDQVFYYSLLAEGVDDIRAAQFQGRYDALVNAPPDSVGERLAHAFAWMSRARRQRDQETRLLFFSTAIESLLSAQADRGAPVTDTIARSASVLIASDPIERLKVYRYAKRLYGRRSAVAHRGESNISEGEAIEIQSIAEQIGKRILGTVDLGEKHETIRDKLLEASFGSPWQPSADL